MLVGLTIHPTASQTIGWRRSVWLRALPDAPSMSVSPHSEYPVLIGTVIAQKYVVERQLGAGGMGVVFLAQHIDLARPVAVKLIRRELMETESIAERFLREARAAARIQSEHVGRVLDVGRLDTGEPFIVMEYLEGRDLADELLGHRRFAPAEAVDLILEAGEAIAEAHQAQIVHRDLKPENLFLARQPDGASIVKVLDFGISKQLGEASQRVLTSPSTALGSPQYMAPEQMEGVHVDVRADIWALGAILYEMVCGAKAFTGETLAQVCVQVMSGSFKPIRELAPEVPADLAVAIEQCLQLEKTERFDNMSAFANALMPYGSERARTSATRIARVLGLRPPHDDRISSDRTSSLGGSAPGDVDPMRRTEAATPVAREASAALPASSHTVEVNRSSSRWPVFLGLGGVIVLGAVLWAFTRNAVSEVEAERARAQAAATSFAGPATVVEPATPAPGLPSTPVETGADEVDRAIQANGDETAADAGVERIPASPAAKPPVRAAPTPHAVKRSDRGAGNVNQSRGQTPGTGATAAPASPPPAVRQRAYDRDSFGGRR